MAFLLLKLFLQLLSKAGQNFFMNIPAQNLIPEFFPAFITEDPGYLNGNFLIKKLLQYSSSEKYLSPQGVFEMNLHVRQLPSAARHKLGRFNFQLHFVVVETVTVSSSSQNSRTLIVVVNKLQLNVFKINHYPRSSTADLRDSETQQILSFLNVPQIERVRHYLSLW